MHETNGDSHRELIVSVTSIYQLLEGLDKIPKEEARRHLMTANLELMQASASLERQQIERLLKDEEICISVAINKLTTDIREIIGTIIEQFANIDKLEKLEKAVLQFVSRRIEDAIRAIQKIHTAATNKEEYATYKANTINAARVFFGRQAFTNRNSVPFNRARFEEPIKGDEITTLEPIPISHDQFMAIHASEISKFEECEWSRIVFCLDKDDGLIFYVIAEDGTGQINDCVRLRRFDKYSRLLVRQQLSRSWWYRILPNSWQYFLFEALVKRNREKLAIQNRRALPPES